MLEHALGMDELRVRIYGYSKLVVSQLTGVWKCKAPNLVMYYERGLALMRRMQQQSADSRRVCYRHRSVP